MKKWSDKRIYLEYLCQETGGRMGVELADELDELRRIEDNIKCEQFDSRQESVAFMLGIEYVNDSDISLSGPYEAENGMWKVYIEDDSHFSE